MSKLLNYFKKNKIVLSQETKQQILGEKQEKLIKIKFDCDMFKFGLDESQLFATSVVKLLFDNQKSYLYVAGHGNSYGWAFGNFFKIQNQSDESHIWKYINQLDKIGYVCLNDIYDKFDNGESNKKPNKKNKVAIKFLNLIKKNIDELVEDFSDSESDKELILQAILHIYVTNKKFFNKHIEIDEDSFNSIKNTLQTSKYMVLYEKEKIKNNLPSHIISSNQKTSSFKI